MTWDQLKAKLPPTDRAALDALQKAYADPGVVVRVTLTKAEDTETIHVLAGLTWEHGTYKAHNVEGGINIELTNGSLIEFALDLAKA